MTVHGFRKTGLVRVVVVLGVVVMAGCSGGSGEQAADRETPSGDPEPVSGPLRRDIHLPDVAVWDVEGAEHSIRDLVAPDYTVIFFISTGCEVCEELVGNWRGMLDRIPEDLHVIAVVDESVEFGRQWAQKNDFPFPLYMDRLSVFADTWSVNAYPTVAGVAPDNWILFARRGIAPAGFTPARAETLLARGERKRKP